jgi:hypothetical protein
VDNDPAVRKSTFLKMHGLKVIQTAGKTTKSMDNIKTLIDLR